VEVHEFDQVDGQYFMAIEYVHGYTLAEVLRRLPEGQGFPPRIVAKLGMQICQGLAYAHAARDERSEPMNLVHRDLKPANVMIHREGVVKIADFGIAKATTNLSQTQTGFTRGTPSYMSPEQALGAVKQPIDRRSDLFSLASVLAEALTGRLTFDADETLTVLNLVASADVDDTLDRILELAPPFVPILQRAFSKRPQDRHADAVELGQQIRAAYDDLPGPQPHLASWLARSMGEDQPTSLDREIDPLTTTDSRTAADPPADLHPGPEPTIPSGRSHAADAPPASIPTDSRLTADGDGLPEPPVAAPPRRARPSASSAPARAGRGGSWLVPIGVAIIVVGLVGGLSYVSLFGWQLPPGMGEQGDTATHERGRVTTTAADIEAAGPVVIPAEESEARSLPADAEGTGTPGAARTFQRAGPDLASALDARPRLKQCLRKHQRTHGEFASVEVTFTMVADGSIEGAALDAPGSVDPELGQCLLDGLARLRLRAHAPDEPTRLRHGFGPVQSGP